jgi:glycosyltransferase involved in cell wall biosynthesis
MDNQQLLKIAIACPGVGLVQRGFERYFTDLFHLLADDYDITLFKGGGEVTDKEKVLPFIYRNGAVAKLFPIHQLFGRTAMHTECLTFALALLWQIKQHHYTLVHCIDPPLARILFKLRQLFGMDFKLLYTEGCAMPPQDYPPADHIHQVAEQTLQEALAFGIPDYEMTLVPCGIDANRFSSVHSKVELRQQYGIEPNTFVILSVAALNRKHKRMDHLIEEVAQLQGNFLLWLDSSMDQGDADLMDLAKTKLGDKCRLTHVASSQVGELYKLADVLVHAATAESFGLAIVEASASGLPVLIHDAPHFKWLIPNDASHVDMTVTGALAARLKALMINPGKLEAMRCQAHTRKRFDWPQLKAMYKALYENMQAIGLRKAA